MKLKPSDYVHLHNHTQFSLLDGLTRIPDLVNFVKDTGMEAVAMTDHGTLSGAIEFYKEATANGVKPIVGIETYVAARKHTDKDPQKDKQRYHLILLAMNHKGYQNLMQLSTTANLDGYYYYPRIDHDLLEKYNEGVIALSACMSGEVGDRLRGGQYDQAKEVAQWYKSIFGDRYYLEIQDHGHPNNPLYSEDQGRINEQVLQLGKELDIPVVVTCDAHYLKHEDQDAHEILLCVGTGSFLSDEKRMSLKDFPLHVVEPQELIDRWGDEHPEVITNTKAIADRCNLEIELGKILIPKFPVPKGEDEKSYLDKLTYRGLAWRYGGIAEKDAAELTIEEAKKCLPKDVLERTEYELQIIDSMGFNGYFLIIWDFMSWGKNEGIIFGPGRGSAAGSIISYALKITELDPLKYDLLFERFLNPDRISMPDVDIDIQDTRRDEVIEYCARKYGQERVANIVTFGRMFARNAVRDVARVLQVPYADADRLAKMIPAPVQGHHIPLPTSLEKDADLKKEYETNEISRKVLDQAVVLEGTVRSHGIHAAGVVIAPDDIVKFAPLEMAQKGVVSTQYPKDPIEELGLLKMDFLGLSNLTIINNALRIIRKVYDREIDINQIPLDDAKTYELFQAGDTTGVFQLESAGMKRYLKELKPTVFEDIVAMVALYRPGPMQFIDDFIARKHGEKEIIYPHLSMENALKNTYGVMVYQEQVMQISKEVCGFTGGEADTLRKAIGKKKIDVMRKMKDKMIAGAEKTSGIDQATMEAFWLQLEDFAQYCFNKAHAACYGLIAYQTAYLKAHYPAAFMAALMTSDYDDTDRLSIEITECKHMGIAVLQPDVNESFLEFAVVHRPQTDRIVHLDAPHGAAEERSEAYRAYDERVPEAATKRSAKSTSGVAGSAGQQAGVVHDSIRFGMNAIKNVGTAAVEEILRARKECGQFETLEQFFECVNVRVVNRKALESLIKAGAFDRYGERSMLLHNLDAMLAYAQRLQKQLASGQTDLFGALDEAVAVKAKLSLEEPVTKYDIHEQLLWERELLGLYLSQNPLELFETYLREQASPISSLKPELDGKLVTIGGAIADVREITTKNGQKMAFVKLEDPTGETEAILFPNAYQQTARMWVRDHVVIIKGRANAKDRDGNIGTEVKVMVEDAKEITAAEAQAYESTADAPKIPKGSMAKKLAATVAKNATTVSIKPIVEPAKKPPLQERVYIRVLDSNDQQTLMSLKQTLDKFRGDTEVVLVLGKADGKQAIKLPSGIVKSDEVFTSLRTLVGTENLVVQ